jgi:large subunit ribosomal protein L4
MAVGTYTKSGTKAATPAKLDKAVFGVEVNSHQLLKEAYLGYLANGRTNNAVTKKRGEVRGGGRKPWRQKGTGNARFGSSRNPIWRSGGIAFGPTGNENYSRKLSVASKRQALRQALSLAASEDRIKVIETFACPDGKVKPTLQLIQKIGANLPAIIVVSVKDSLVHRVQSKYLNVYDVMNSETIIISKKSLDIVNELLGTK